MSCQENTTPTRPRPILQRAIADSTRARRFVAPQAARLDRGDLVSQGIVVRLTFGAAFESPSVGCDLPRYGRTMLLIGPLWAIASVGTPRGHSLHWGSPRRVRETSGRVDALPRTFLDAQRRTPRTTSMPSLTPRLRPVGPDLHARWVVHLLVLPHRQHDRGDPPGQGELGQVWLHSSLEPALIVRVQGMVHELRDHGRRRTLEDRFQHRLTLAAQATRLQDLRLRPSLVLGLDPV